MTPDSGNSNEEIQARQEQLEEEHPEELNATKRIVREPQEQLDLPQEPEEKKSLLQRLRAAYRRARDGRYGGVGAAKRVGRSAKTMDRSKGLVVLMVAALLVALVLIGMFSHANSDKPETTARRTTPSLGRPEQSADSKQRKKGSLTPLLNADLSSQNPNND